MGGTSVLHDEALQGVLGVYQKLISSRAMQQHGFSLVTAIVVHLPLCVGRRIRAVEPPPSLATHSPAPLLPSAAFQKYLGTILQLMLSLLHRGLQGKVVRPFLGFVGRLIGKHGPGPFLEALVGIQSTCGAALPLEGRWRGSHSHASPPRLPNMVIAQIVVPKMPLVLNPLERASPSPPSTACRARPSPSPFPTPTGKCLAVGVSRLLAESPVMAQSPLDQSLCVAAGSKG